MPQAQFDSSFPKWQALLTLGTNKNVNGLWRPPWLYSVVLPDYLKASHLQEKFTTFSWFLELHPRCSIPSGSSIFRYNPCMPMFNMHLSSRWLTCQSTPVKVADLEMREGGCSVLGLLYSLRTLEMLYLSYLHLKVFRGTDGADEETSWGKM